MPPQPSPHPHLIAIFGPTASGKSALALTISESFNAEIISADSRQVYRYMDIGTDKASPSDQSRVPHHLIDIVNPDENYTLGLYQQDAYSAINNILARGLLPILAGGTPLYINAVLEGWTIPRVEPDPAFRDALYAQAEADGVAPLYARLTHLDPKAAAGILPTNTRRIIRALEVIHSTGQLMSAQQAKSAPPYSILGILLESDRTTLYKRIDARVDTYIQRGLVHEVQSLKGRGYPFDLPSMSGIGYRQVGDYLTGKATLPEAIQRIKYDTHAFVRHQVNWFRRHQTANRIDVTTHPPTEQALQLVRDFLAQHPQSTRNPP
ncbi:MAG: tRNA (adenosine(37)-N6)-dimethylallyltransferase MiaA, partial [Chloroflexia bacterium]